LELKSEALLQSDRTQKAALLYEAAYLTEAVLHHPAHAVQDYLAAYNSDSRSRLPLFALLRMFERRSSYKNLARLYDAELRGARSPHEKAIALVDLASLDLVHGGDAQAAAARLWRALECDVAGEAALVLEHNRRAAGDSEGALKALIARVESCDDVAQRGVLLLELAQAREQAGEIGAALDTLRRAAFEKPVREIFLVALTRFARQHGFTAELVEASELRAELIASELSERLVDSEPDQALIELLRSRAVALWYEAARSRITSLSDPRGAIDCLSKALTIRPDDLLLRKTRMLAFDLLEDRASAAEEAKALLDQGADGEDAAPLHFRLAEHALVAGDPGKARESLMEAIATASGSIAADTILDDLLLDEQRQLDRIERRESRAATGDAERAGRWLLEAAQLAAHELRDSERARHLFERSEHKFPQQVETARSAYAAGLSTRDPALQRFAVQRMLALDLDAQEQAAVLHHALDLAEDASAARALLTRALEAREPQKGLARIARQRAAETQDFALLGRAHEALAALETRDDEVLAHLCGSARASARAGDLPQARTLLEQALGRDPTHPYAGALLEEVFRRQGQSEELLALLGRSAQHQENAENTQDALLTAGLSAERAGDGARARKLYEDAAQKGAHAVSALWCLSRLAAREGDAALLKSSQQRLAELELARGEPGLECLLGSELLETPAALDPVDTLSSVLSTPKLACHAALALALGPNVPDEPRERALDVLEASSTGAERALVVREQLSRALLAGEHHARILDLSEDVLKLAPDDVWAAFVRTCVPLPHDEDGHADALIAVAAQARDAQLKHALEAEALWIRRLVRSGPLNDGLVLSADKSATLAQVVHALAAPQRDAEARALALSCGLAEASGEERLDQQLLLARAELSRGDALAALSLTNAILEEQPDETCALELKRVASRAAGDFTALVAAAEALAQLVDDDFALTLLEESALVRSEQLGDSEGAERLLVRVLSRAPTRKLAYGRLHELLRAKPDSTELIALVRARTEHVHDAEELVKLFYELARLHRARGEVDQALDAVDNVLMLDEHVGALALAAEIHTSREEWDEAVRALTSLAGAAGMPKAQRRLARLAAADFLLHRLNRPADALAALELVAADGNPDTDLQQRIADVAERAGQAQRASEALVAAAEGAAAPDRPRLLKRAARLQRDALHREGEAAALFRKVLEATPRDREVVGELWAISHDKTMLERFERELRAALQAAPLEATPLRDLLFWSELASDADAAFVALTGLSVLGHANEHERKLSDAALKSALTHKPSSGQRLSAAELSALLAPGPDPRYAAVLHCVLSAASEIDQLEPGKFGAGRGQRTNPRDKSPLRDEVLQLCSVLGLSLGDLYVGGNDLLRIAAMPRDDGVGLVLGMGIHPPLGATRRSQLALQLAACQLHALPLLSRTNIQGARLIWGALVAAECPRLAPVALEELGELPRTLSRALPRKTKKALPELAAQLPDGGADMPRQCALLLQQTRRLGLLLAGDLPASLDDVVGALPSRDTIGASEGALDLIRTWTGAGLAGLRKKLGLAL
jgi:hypothetical protein